MKPLLSNTGNYYVQVGYQKMMNQISMGSTPIGLQPRASFVNVSTMNNMSPPTLQQVRNFRGRNLKP